MFFPPRQIATFSSGASIYIGSLETSQSRAFMKRNSIKLIVNCTKDIPFAFPDIDGIRLPIHDIPSEAPTFLRLVPGVCRVIDQYISQGQSVLVHCAAGISRSASVCAAYLIIYNGFSAAEAIAFIQTKKPECFGGSVFVKALSKLKRR